MLTNNFELIQIHEVQAAKMMHYGASKGTITAILGYMPKNAELLRRRNNHKSKTRVGSKRRFLDTCERSWRYSNILWITYARLSGDMYLDKGICVDSMLNAFSFTKRMHPQMDNYLDFNRWYSALTMVRDNSVFITNCTTCSNPYLARKTIFTALCSCCIENDDANANIDAKENARRQTKSDEIYR